MSKTPQWDSLTTNEARHASEQDPVVVLPLAATEQHGPHLPLSTDVDIGMGLLAAAFGHLPRGFPAWVLPAQPVGASREHARFPGTISLDPEELSTVIYRHGVALSSCGVRRMVLSNSHGGNRAALATAGLKLRDELEMLVVTAHYFLFPRPPDVDLPDTEWRYGLHGGAIETSMMLSLCPDRVRTEYLADARSLAEDLDETLERVSSDNESASAAWIAGDLNSSGVVGNSSLASPQLGRQLVSYYGERLAEVIRDARAFPVERLVSR